VAKLIVTLNDHLGSGSLAFLGSYFNINALENLGITDRWFFGVATPIRDQANEHIQEARA